MASSLRIHTQIASATAIVGIGERVVSSTWKQTANQTKKERAVIVPFDVLSAPEVPEAFRPLVEAVLLSSAEQVLKDFVNASENNFEILASQFSRENLVESYMSTKDNWISKEELEKLFTASATWKRITSSPNFSTNATYQAAANSYKDMILKLSAKPTYFPQDRRDVLIAKMDEGDLNSELGGFVLRRCEQMKKKDCVESFSLDML